MISMRRGLRWIIDRLHDAIEVRSAVCTGAFPVLYYPPRHWLRKSATCTLDGLTYSLSMRLPLRTHGSNNSTLAAEAGLP